MKRTIKTYFKFFILFLGITILLVNCEQENNDSESYQDLTSTKFVNVKDIPEVLNFIKSKTNEDLQFVLKSITGVNEFQRGYEEDMIVGTVLTNQIKQLTNSYGKSNYTFILEKPVEDIDKVYFMNLIVKQYKDSLYAFIIKYIPTDEWIRTSFIDERSMSTFTGTLYFYSQEGIYTGKIEMNNGVSTKTINENPCGDGDGSSGSVDFPDTGDYTNTGNDNSNGENSNEGGGSNHHCELEWVLFYDSQGNSAYLPVCPDDPMPIANSPITQLLNTLRTGNPCEPDTELGGGNSNGSNENSNTGVLLDYDFLIIPSIRNINNCLENTLTSEQSIWLNNPNNSLEVISISNYASIFTYCSEDVKNFEHAQIELGQISNSITLSPQIGFLNGRSDQKYTHFGTDNIYNYYRMEDGSDVIRSSTILSLNSNGNLVNQFTSESDNSYYWYIKTPETNLWSNYLIKETDSDLYGDLETLFILGTQDLALTIGTYVVPAEEIKILFTGTDFNGEPTSQWLAAGMLFVEIVPGGKLVKAVKFIPAGVLKWGKVVSKVGGGQTKLIFEKIDGVIHFGLNGSILKHVIGSAGTGLHAHHIIPWALRKHDMVQKAAQADKKFHINEALNGIPLDPSFHLKGHPKYSDKIEVILVENFNPNMTNEQAYNFIVGLNGHIENLINTNQNLNLGQIADLINYP